MSIKANKGEHSEVLVFLRVLEMGRIQVADKDGKPKNSWLNVISVTRSEEDGRTYIIDDTKVRAFDSAGVEVFSIERSEVGLLADQLLPQIKEGKGASFECVATDEMASLFKLSSIKAAASAKADIFITIASPVFENETSSYGFSVKSEIGGLPTLLNAGATHFEYKVTGCSSDDAWQIQEDEHRAEGKEYPGPMKVIPAIYEKAHGQLEFVRVVEPVFEQNLKMIDTSFPRILADVLKHAYLQGDLNLSTATDSAALIEEVSQFLGLPHLQTKRLIKHKLKELLRQSALGMNPGRPWDGQVEAHGGWIIVGEDGTLRCFHLVNDDEFRVYLLNSCKIDTPSMSRHEAGYVYKQAGEVNASLRLSLQVRFM